MTWGPLPEGGPLRVRERLMAGIDPEFSGRTLVDDLVATGDASVSGDISVTGDIGGASLDLAYTATNPAASDGPDDYPAGRSVSLLSSATGWPHASGTVETFVDLDDNRAWQECRKSTYGPRYIRYYSTDSAWSDWRLADTILKGSSDGTRYTENTTSSWETQASYAVTSLLPTSNFACEVHVDANCWIYNAGSLLARAQVGISLDGGTSYTYGRPTIQSLTADVDYANLAFRAKVSGSPSGAIYVRWQLYTDTAGLQADDFEYNVTIGPDY